DLVQKEAIWWILPRLADSSVQPSYPSLAGCGGVLTDLNGCICRLFFVPLGTLPSANAEIHAIYIALRLFAASPWLS
ncbi:hypothetical protein Goshw_023634, partial [Gossypium schwendimanii]|nr:hypothetical protein [Gossypium schwendimanii]